MGTTDNTAVQTATQNLQNKSLANAATSSGLSGSVGMGARNTPEDVMKVSSALTANGLMEAPQSHADNTLFKGIIGAQERMDGALKRDGLVNPGGPTEQTFSRLAGQGFVKPVPAHPATPAAPAQPATGNSALNAEIRAGNKQNAVAAAQARVKANLSDGNRSDFRKAQDRQRLEKAREAAERAEGRTRHEEAEQRRRNLEQQAEAQRKATADAEKQAVHAGKAVNAGLTKLVNQAGKAIDNAVRHAQQNADLPSRHPRVREAGLAQSANPGLSSVDVESRARGNDKLVAGRNAITLSDDAVASNRRTADALGKVRGVGDLPRFTADAINTDPGSGSGTGGDKAVYEVADLIGQVRARDPEQAKELIDKTIRGIGADHRTRLEAMFDGRGVEDLHIDGHLRRPETPSHAEWRTKEMTAEDKANLEGLYNDKLHRPEDGEYAVQLREAEAGAGAHPAEDDGSGTPSKPNTVSDGLKSPDDLLLEPGAKYRDPDEWRSKLGETVGETRRDIKEGILRAGAEVGNAAGLDQAARYLKHFLDGSGKDIVVPRDEARKDPFISESEATNRKQFEEKTFLGKTKTNTKLNNDLRSLKDGQAIDLDDKWDREMSFGTIDQPGYADEFKRVLEPDRLLAFGSLDFKSKVNAQSTRDGNVVRIEGTVTHNGDDKYDFNDNSESFGAYELQQSGRGKPFLVQQNWQQRVFGTVKILGKDSSGRLVLGQPEFKWEDID